MTAHRTLLAALVLALTSLGLSGCAFEGETAIESDSALSGRPYFEVWRAQNGRHYFHLSAANHEIILASQGYSTRTAALNGVLSVLDNGEIQSRYELRQASNGQHYFVLKARNGEIIGVSETYVSRSNAQRGVDGVIRNVIAYQEFLANRTGARFDVFQGRDGRYYFNLHAQNGEIVLSSQGYLDEASALNATFSVAENGLDAARYDVRQAQNGQWYFNLIATNGQVIGTSETYVSKYNAQRGRDAIVALLPSVELL